MAIFPAVTLKNSRVKSGIFVFSLAFCLAVAGLLWYLFPSNDKLTGVEEIGGKFVFKELGLVLAYNSDMLTWPEAHKACTERQGHLAYPRSSAEAQGMLRIIRSNAVSAVHVGFHDFYVHNEYVTVRGESLRNLGYHPLKMPLPGSGPHAKCGKMSRKSLMATKCSEKLTSICRLPMWEEYDLVPGFGYYKLHNATGWSKAWSTCRKEGAHLLVLRSEAEMEAMLRMMADKSLLEENAVVHYGAHRVFSDAVVTIFDEPLQSSGYHSWVSTNVSEWSDGNVAFVALHLSLSSPRAVQGLSMTPRGPMSLPFICKHSLYQ